MREAFHIARTGRPGPVLVDIPKDVLISDDRVRVPGAESACRGYRPPSTRRDAGPASRAELIAHGASGRSSWPGTAS